MKFFVKPTAARNKKSTAFTARLASAVSGKAQVGMRVFLEGPYSGVDNASLLARFEHVVYIAGGSGAGFSLGVVEDAIRSQQRKNNAATVQVVYATRSVGVARWYKDKIEDIMMMDSGCCCRVAASIHVTSAERKKTSTQKQLQDTTEVPKTDTEKITDSTSPSDSSSTESPPLSSKHIQIYNDNQRPNIKSVISSACRSDNRKKTAVVVCGPASMIQDARQAVADEQARLLKEESGLGEVYLHVEAFS
jgi:ferric-chelate reductase